MELIRPSHDELVKYLMADRTIAKDFFTVHLPVTILEKVDLDTLKMESASYVDEELSKHDSDVVFSVKLKNQQDAIFYLVEHQSQSDPLMAFRLQYYMMQLLKRYVIQNKEKALPLPLIYPLVLYNGYKPYEHTRNMFTLFGELESFAKEIFLQPFQLIDVGQFSDDDIRRHKLAGLLELSLCRAVIRQVGQEMKLLAELYEKYHQQVDGHIFDVVLKYDVYKWDEAEDKPEDYLAQAKQLLPPELEKQTMTFAEAFMAKGEARGEARGKAMTLDSTRQAIEMLKQSITPERVAQETGLDINMVIFLRDNMFH